MKEFENKALVQSGMNQIAMSAAAQKQIAMIQGWYILANHNPRREQECKKELLAICENERFAAKALYTVNVGSKYNEQTRTWDKVYDTNFNIRFAEEAFRVWGHMKKIVDPLEEDDQTIKVRVTVLDAQTGAEHQDIVTLSKLTERSKLKAGQEPVDQRTNSKGKIVYIVKATEQETRSRLLGLIARSERKSILKLISYTAKLECFTRIMETRKGKINKNIITERQGIVSRFLDLGIPQEEIEQHIKKKLDSFNVDDILFFETLLNALESHEIRWNDIFDSDKDKEPETTTVDLSKIKPEPQKETRPGQNEKPPTETKPEATVTPTPKETPVTEPPTDPPLPKLIQRAKTDYEALDDRGKYTVRTAIGAARIVFKSMGDDKALQVINEVAKVKKGSEPESGEESEMADQGEF